MGRHFPAATRVRCHRHSAAEGATWLRRRRLLAGGAWRCAIPAYVRYVAYFAAGNYCVDSHVTRYLVTGQVPAAGTVCQPEGSPFGPTSAAALQEAQAGAVLQALAVPEAVRRALHAR